MIDINEVLTVLGDLPWIRMIIGAIIAFALSFVWYGYIFRDKYISLTGKSKNEKVNTIALTVQLLSILKLSFLLGVFSFIESPYSFLMMLSLIALILLATLSGFLFQHGNNKKTLQLWGIVAGKDTLDIILIFSIIEFI